MRGKDQQRWYKGSDWEENVQNELSENVLMKFIALYPN